MFLVYKTFNKLKKLIPLMFGTFCKAYVFRTLIFLIDYVAKPFNPFCPFGFENF